MTAAAKLCYMTSLLFLNVDCQLDIPTLIQPNKPLFYVHSLITKECQLEAQHQTGIIILIFLAGALFVGGLTRHLLKRTNIPYTIALLMIGLIVGMMSHTPIIAPDTNHLLLQIIHVVGQVDPQLVLFVFLPILIFESAFSLDVHLFNRLLSQITILAVPCLILCIALTAAAIQFIFPLNWSWPVCLMFAALISATDPVAVVALLREVSSRKQLETLIEGESLLNDGTAIVCFTIFYAMVTNSGATFVLSAFVTDFFYVVCAGGLVGVLVGLAATFWWSKIFNDPMIEISISIMGAFSAFLIAEHALHVSGVVAVVTCALMMAGYGRTKVSPEVSDFLHHFWSMMGFIAETIVFLIVGIVIGHRTGVPSSSLWITLIGLYGAIMAIRYIAIGLLYPALKRLGMGFNVATHCVLTWGGLRGVVGLTLALAAIQDPKLSNTLGEEILFLTAGIVVLTIILNGSTMLRLLTFFGLDKLPIAKFLTVRRAKLQIDEALRRYYPELKQHTIFKEANWPLVESVAGIDDAIIAEDIKAEGQALLSVAEEDLIAASKRRMLEIEKRSYWKQLHEGELGNTAANILMSSVDHAIDKGAKINQRNDLNKYWQQRKILIAFSDKPVLRHFILAHLFKQFTIGYELAKGFLQAQQELLGHLTAIAPDRETRLEIIHAIEQNKIEVNQHIEAMRHYVPDLLRQLETYAAARSLLYKKRSIIQQLVEDGLLNETETKKMILHVEEKMQRLNHKVFDE